MNDEEQNTDKLNKDDNKIVTFILLGLLLVFGLLSGILGYWLYSVNGTDINIQTIKTSNCEIEQEVVFVPVNHSVVQKDNKTLHQYTLKPQK